MTLSQLFTEIANAIRAKKKSSEPIIAEDFPEEIASIESGTTSVTKKEVNFYDYDGTLLYAYNPSEFAELSTMPENPNHEGLISQGWNWSLADAKAFVEKYEEIDIGQIYTTSSGVSEFDIELTPSTGLTVTINLDGQKNWGDGTIDELTTHTYNGFGKYTISCDGTIMTTSSGSGLFGQSSSAYNYYVRGIRLANITDIRAYAFQFCYSIKNIIIPDTVRNIESRVFYMCGSATSVIMPHSLTNLYDNAFSNSKINLIVFSNGLKSVGTFLTTCTRLKKVVIPDSITNVGQSAFYGCEDLVSITIPDSFSSIGMNFFGYCYSLEYYDFSAFTRVPTLAHKSVFSGINAIAKIVVPDNLYESWKSAYNWSNFANYIVKKSEV